MKVTVWPTVEGLSDDFNVVAVESRTGALTDCEGSDPLLAFTFASPLYDAETVCEPAASVEVVNWAWSLPPTSAIVTGVCAWPSMVKVTVPVGVPEYDDAATVAVKVTCWPTVDGSSRRRDGCCRCLAGPAR